MPVPLAPTTISCDPVVHSEPASSMLATPSAPSCLPSNAAPVVALAPSPAPGRRRRGRPAPPRRSPPATRYPGQTTGRCRSRPNAPRASRLRSARERLRKRPASRSRTRPAPARPRPCAIRCSGRKQHLAEGPSSIPTRAPLLLRIAPSLDFQLPGFVLVDAGLQWRRTVVPGRRTHARRRADFTGSPVSVIDCAPAPHGAISIAAAAQARTAPPGPPARVISDTTVHAPIHGGGRACRCGSYRGF